MSNAGDPPIQSDVRRQHGVYVDRNEIGALVMQFELKAAEADAAAAAYLADQRYRRTQEVVGRLFGGIGVRRI